MNAMWSVCVCVLIHDETVFITVVVVVVVVVVSDFCSKKKVCFSLVEKKRNEREKRKKFLATFFLSFLSSLWFWKKSTEDARKTPKKLASHTTKKTSWTDDEGENYFRARDEFTDEFVAKENAHTKTWVREREKRALYRREKNWIKKQTKAIISFTILLLRVFFLVTQKKKKKKKEERRRRRSKCLSRTRKWSIWSTGGRRYR